LRWALNFSHDRSSYIHERFRTLDRRLCDMRADWRVELKYAKDGLTARLKHLEQR
jgi:hypothetical protein